MLILSRAGRSGVAARLADEVVVVVAGFFYV